MNKKKEFKLSKPKIIDVYNKKMGYWYVYSNQSYWDAEKQQTRHVRRTIGKRLTKNGPIIYNNRFKAEQLQKDGLASVEISATTYLGETLVLDHIVSNLGLRCHLCNAFGKNDAEAIIGLAQYIICTKGALSWAGDWSAGRDGRIDHLDSQKVHKFLQSLDAKRRDAFFSFWKQANKNSGGYFCFDLTNISVHNTESSILVELCHDHEHIRLPQTNLAIFANQREQIPMHQLLYQGSRSDSISVQDLISQLDKLGLDDICLTLDESYYSEQNLQLLHRSGYDYIISVPHHVEMQYAVIDAVRDRLFSLEARTEVTNEYGESTFVQCISQHLSDDECRQYLIVIYDPAVRAETERMFGDLLATCKAELESGEFVGAHQRLYEQFFEVKEIPKQGRRVVEKETAIAEFQKGCRGYRCLLTNHKRSKEEILYADEQGKIIKIFYDTVKQELNSNRIRGHNRGSFEGKMFVLFIALAILIKLKSTLAEQRKLNKELTRLTTYSQLLFQMSTLSETKFRGKHEPIYSTPNKIQNEVIKSFGLDWPTD